MNRGGSRLLQFLPRLNEVTGSTACDNKSVKEKDLRHPHLSVSSVVVLSSDHGHGPCASGWPT